MVFPALFTAGMSLVDTTDGVLMLRAYGWAFIKPIRKLYYNLTITLLSVFVAIVIGSIEALGLLVDQLSLSGRVWKIIEALNNHLGSLGFVIIAICVASWMASIAVCQIAGYDTAARQQD